MIKATRTKLLHITTVSDSLIFLRGQVRYMRSMGIDISAITAPGDRVSIFEKEEGAPVYTLPMKRQITPLADIKTIWSMVLIMRKIKPDIVHAHTPKGGLLGMIAATLARVPIKIYHVRGLPFTTAHGRLRKLLKTTETISCKLAHSVIAVSNSLRAILDVEGIYPADKVHVLMNGSGNGVDANTRFNPNRAPAIRETIRKQYDIPADAIVIGFVGRLVRDKGVIELAAAWQQVRQVIPNVYLLIVGPTEHRDAVPPHVIESLYSDSQVRIVGSQEDLSSFYMAMDIFTLPTYREGFPNAVLEASAMGKPVVSTMVTGAVDAVSHGITGTLVPARDSAALASSLITYARDENMRLHHGNAGRKWMLESFQPSTIWAALLDQYTQLLAIRLPQLEAEYQSSVPVG